jgi:hypothetical protein
MTREYLSKQIEDFKKKHNNSEIVLLCNPNRKNEFEKITDIEVKGVLNMEENMYVLIDKFYLDNFIFDNSSKA